MKRIVVTAALCLASASPALAQYYPQPGYTPPTSYGAPSNPYYAGPGAGSAGDGGSCVGAGTCDASGNNLSDEYNDLRASGAVPGQEPNTAPYLPNRP